MGDDRAVPVVEMLVVIQDWIGIGIATNASFKIRETLRCSDTRASPQRKRDVRCQTGSASRDTINIEILLREIVPIR